MELPLGLFPDRSNLGPPPPSGSYKYHTPGTYCGKSDITIGTTLPYGNLQTSKTVSETIKSAKMCDFDFTFLKWDELESSVSSTVTIDGDFTTESGLYYVEWATGVNGTEGSCMPEGVNPSDFLLDTFSQPDQDWDQTTNSSTVVMTRYSTDGTESGLRSDSRTTLTALGVARSQRPEDTNTKRQCKDLVRLSVLRRQYMKRYLSKRMNGAWPKPAALHPTQNCTK